MSTKHATHAAARAATDRPVTDRHATDRANAGGSAAVPKYRSADPTVIVDLVDQIVSDAIAQRASDVHVEPEEAALVVRYRVDGVLRDARLLPKAMAAPLVSRVKIMAGLDIADRLRPQDGRTRVKADGRGVDLRVSTLPAAHGEKLVLRLLDVGATALALESLGFLDDDLARLDALLDAREGLVLVTGPTGSGKTTTLYSALRRVQRRGVNVVTVEDPVEYRIPGIVQVQVNEKAGLTFAAALRSILRQDPDVVLVGEIRDRETAGIAVQAALTGHLVLSTLHTMDAPSAVTRLVDVGVEPYRIAAALKGVIAQRLVRRLCETCRVAAPDAWRDPRLVAAGVALAPAGLPPSACAPGGCDACGGTGHRGRAAVAEVLLAGADLSRRIALAEPPARMAEAARAGGMRTLWESGLAQLARGVTSVDELLRVLEPPRAPDGGPRSDERTSGAALVGLPRTCDGAEARRPLPDLDGHFELTDWP